LAVAAATVLALVLANPVKRDPIGSARPSQVTPSPSRSHRGHPAPSRSRRSMLAPPPALARGRSTKARGDPQGPPPTPPIKAPYTPGRPSPLTNRPSRGLHGVAEADLSEWCESWRARFLRERL